MRSDIVYVVVAKWHVSEGKVDDVLSILREVVPLSRAEEGNHAYIINRSSDDPNLIMLYEQYVDEAAFQFHAGRQEFAELVRGKIWPMLESREREIYTVVDFD
jgi:quinol monooxygenase YgiN